MAEEASSCDVVGMVNGYVIVLLDVLCELSILGIVFFGCKIIFYYHFQSIARWRTESKLHLKVMVGNEEFLQCTHGCFIANMGEI